MAKANAARNAHNMRMFEYMQNKLIASIDKRAKEKAAEEDVMNEHYVGSNSEDERWWSF